MWFRWRSGTTARQHRLMFETCFSSLLVRPQLMVSQVYSSIGPENVFISRMWLLPMAGQRFSSLTTTVDATKTGEYVLTFATSALGGSHRSAVSDQRRSSAVGGTFLGSNAFTYTHPGWATLDLTRELNLHLNAYDPSSGSKQIWGLWG